MGWYALGMLNQLRFLKNSELGNSQRAHPKT
jgi:hypothetical protein